MPAAVPSIFTHLPDWATIIGLPAVWGLFSIGLVWLLLRTVAPILFERAQIKAYFAQRPWATQLILLPVAATPFLVMCFLVGHLVISYILPEVSRQRELEEYRARIAEIETRSQAAMAARTAWLTNTVSLEAGANSNFVVSRGFENIRGDRVFTIPVSFGRSFADIPMVFAFPDFVSVNTTQSRVDADVSYRIDVDARQDGANIRIIAHSKSDIWNLRIRWVAIGRANAGT